MLIGPVRHAHGPFFVAFATLRWRRAPAGQGMRAAFAICLPGARIGPDLRLARAHLYVLGANLAELTADHRD